MCDEHESRRDVEEGIDKAYMAEINSQSRVTLNNMFFDAVNAYIDDTGQYTTEQAEIVSFMWDYIKKKI